MTDVKLGSFWRSPDGNLFIVTSTTPLTVSAAPGGEVEGPQQQTDLAGFTYLPDRDSPVLACVDRRAARAALRFLRAEGLSDAFAAGLSVVAPNAAPIIERDLRAAARTNGWGEMATT